MKIVSIVGARPQFIKLAPLSAELRKYHEEVIIHTGQHYDENLSQLFFDELGIPEPDYNLDIGSASHGVQTGKMLARLEDLLLKEEPDMVILFGDTNSTLAGAVAAAKLPVKIAHVEAGMRNFDKRKPEEINRIVTDHVSHLLFAPTSNAVENLKKEGITQGVYNVGDVTYEAVIRNSKIAEKRSDILERLSLKEKQFLVLTIHKQKNTDIEERLKKIVKTATSLDEAIVFPAHPRTQKVLKKYGLWDAINSSHIKLIDPLGYLDFIKLMNNARKIVTDSGGIQREAYILKVPCVTLRKTEWVETVKAGWNIEIDIESDGIVEAIQNFIPRTKQVNIFGDGTTCKKITSIIEEYPQANELSEKESLSFSTAY